MAAAAAVAPLGQAALAVDLNVDGSTYNHPFNANITYDNVRVGISSTGTANQTTGALGSWGYFGIGVNPGSTGTYNLSAGPMVPHEGFVVGDGGTGTFAISGGYVSAFNLDSTKPDLIVGKMTGSQGTVNITGGSLGAGFQIIGNQGTGTVVQTGGSSRAADGLYIGYPFGGAATGSGTYTLWSGSQSVGQFSRDAPTQIGTGVVGTLTNNGGDAIHYGPIVLSSGSGGRGTYNLNGGRTEVKSVGGNVSGGTNATFNFNGGVLVAGLSTTTFMQGLTAANVRNGGVRIDTNGFNVTVAQALQHSAISGDAAIDGGLAKDNSGTLTLTGANTYTGDTYVYGGTLAISAGKVGVASSTALFQVDGPAASAPTASLGGSAVLTDNVAIIGRENAGTFNQSSGTHTVRDILYVGYSGFTSPRTPTNGTYNLSSGTLTAPEVQVANAGTGTFNQTGGTLTTSNLLLGLNGGMGTYNLNGGTLAAAVVGITGIPSNGTLNFSNGTLRATAANADFIKSLTALNVRNGGARIDSNGFAVTINQALQHSTISGDAAADGGLAKSGAGTLTLTAINTYTGQTVVLGGTLAITAGSVGVANSTALFAVAGPTASLATASLGGSATLTNGNASIGYTGAGNGTFNQTGGTHITSALAVGPLSATGSYNLSSTGKLTVNGDAMIGNAGTGTFVQSGGTHNVSASLFVGFPGYSTNQIIGNGTYTLSGGALTTAFTQIGNFATGTFNQSGGNFTTPRMLTGVNGATGTYNLSGTGQLVVNGSLEVGFTGASVFNQSGGTATVSSGLYLAEGTGATGSYNLNGGTLITSAVIGNAGSTNATFNFNGGTLRPAASNANFIRGLTAANVRNGGARIDTGGFSVTADQVLRHSTISGDGATDGGLTKLGSGTLVLNGANTYTGTTTVSAGTLQVKYVAAAASAATPLLAGAGANINGRLVFDYSGSTSPAATVRSLLAASFRATTTPGVMETGTLRSSTATLTRGLGYRDDGAGRVTVLPTLFGDADFDGGVSINDFNALAGNFGQSTGRVWTDGDFDYDGGVSINDFNLLAAGFGQSLPPASDVWAGLLAFAAAHNDLAAFEAITGVPEPAAGTAIGIALASGLRRSRRR